MGIKEEAHYWAEVLNNCRMGLYDEKKEGLMYEEIERFIFTIGAENMLPDFKDVEEQNRVYLFPNGEMVKVEKVTSFAVGRSGTHRLNTADGKKLIIAPGWLSIEIDAEKWSA